MAESSEILSSMRAFYILLSGSIQLKSESLLREEFNDIKDSLLEGVCRFRLFDHSKTKSTESLQSHNYAGISCQILYELSTLLNLDPDDAYRMFQSYILYEFKGTPDMVKLCFANDNSLKIFFENMLEYFHSEKMFAIFSLKLIITNQSSHPFHDLLKQFTKEIKPSLFDCLMKQLNYLENIKSIKKHSMMSYRFRYNSIHFKQKEISELLQVMILYLSDSDFNQFYSKELLKFHKNCSINENQDEISEIHRFVVFLRSISIVTALKPELALAKDEQDVKIHPILEENNQNLKKIILENILSLDNKCQENSFVFLLWVSLFCESEDESIIRMLAKAIRTLDVWSWIDDCLKFSQISSLNNTRTLDVILLTVGQVLSLFFNNFIISEFIVNQNKFNDLIYVLFQTESIARMLKNPLCGFHKILLNELAFFPVNYQTIIRWLEALSKTKECRYLFRERGFCNFINFYCEILDDSLPDIQYINPETVSLLSKRILSNGNSIFCIIPAQTVGEVYNFQDKRIVKWTVDTQIEFWSICEKIAQDLLKRNGMKLFQDNTVNNELEDFKSLMNISREFICRDAQTSNSSILKIANIMIKTFQSVSTNEKNAKFLSISMLKLADLFIRDRLKQPIPSLLIAQEVLPTMLQSSCNLTHILNGGDVHNGSVGYLLGMDEALNGKYELLIEYLRFILSLLKSDKHTSDKYNNIGLPSIVFILRDVFARHRYWNYQKSSDRTIIEKHCLEIFFTLLKYKKSTSLTDTDIIHHVCVIMLMEGQCAETLLHMLVDAEKVVIQKVLQTGNENIFKKDDSILSIRLVLKLISKLLELYPNIKKITGHDNRSVIEENLFSSSVHNRDNILKMITHLVYQKLDINLGRAAMLLLEQLSKQFPMTLLSCLGRNAKFMCENFLSRLDSFTEDIQMKISFLNFFGISLDYQPGLTEMFLNSRAGYEQNCPDILNTILDILKEKKDGQYFCPYELHLTSLQFLSKLFCQPNFVAVGMLKDDKNFWNLLTFPLLELDKEEQLQDLTKNSILASILKIIARYMHLVENKVFPVDCLFDKLIANIVNKERIESIKTRIDKIVQSCVLQQQIQPGSDELIDAWRDFLSIKVITGNAHITSSLLKSIIGNLIKIAQNPLDLPVVNGMLVKYSSLFLLICKNIPDNEPFDDSERQIPDLMKRLTDKPDSTSINVFIYCHSAITQLLLRKGTLKTLTEIHIHCAKTLQTSLITFKDQLKVDGFERYSQWQECDKKFVESNLRTLIDLFLGTLTDSHNEEEIAKLGLQEIVFDLFNLLLEDKCYVLTNILFRIFVGMSLVKGVFGSLLSVSIIEQLTLHFPFDLQEMDVLDDQFENRWNIVTSILILMNNLCLRSRFMAILPVINFVAVQLCFCKKIIKQFCIDKKFNISPTILALARLATTLISFKETWINDHPKSFEEITDLILNLANFCIAAVLRPAALTALSEEKFDDLIVPILTETLCYVDLLSGDYISTDDDFISVEHKLMKSSVDSSGRFHMKKNDAFVISLNMSIPNVDLFDSLSFGGLIHYIIHALKSLFTMERAYVLTENFDEHQRLKKRVSKVVPSMEKAIMIMLKETAILKELTFDDSQKTILYTEIKNEVNNFRSVIHQKQCNRRSNSFTNLGAIAKPGHELLKLGEDSFTSRLLERFERTDEFGDH